MYNKSNKANLINNYIQEKHMNILFFLTPKKDVAFVPENCTLRQALEKMEHHIMQMKILQ